MIKENFEILIHPIWGEIRLDERFSKVLEIREFRQLSQKSQLGSKALSKNILNARHSRLTHSVGVMYVTGLLLDICEKKFSKYFQISKQQRDILMLSALGHDIGHVAYSHSLENRGTKTHEERTIEFFERRADEINAIFGYDITSEVINIFKDNIDIKKTGTDYKVSEELDILFIFKSLLMGTIDCDRIEYLTTDKFMVNGGKSNFVGIFDYITIVLLNDSPTVGFEKGAIPIIEDLLLSRLDQYNYIYYDEDSTLVEMAMKKYIELEEWDEERLVNTNEYDLLSQFNRTITDPAFEGTVKQRLAKIVIDGERKDLMFKKFTSRKSLDYFISRIKSISDDEGLYQVTCKKVKIYNPSKNKVYIKDDDGVVKDIMEMSGKIGEYELEFYYLMLDLDKAYNIDENVSAKLKELFENNPVEIEKKFVLQDLKCPRYEEGIPEETYRRNICSIVEKCLQEIPNTVIGPWETIVNQDTYYKATTKVPEGTAIRYRKNEDAYYIKMPTNDGTTITKREEHKFVNCKNSYEFLQLAKNLFISKNFEIDDNFEIAEEITITTQRNKCMAQVGDSLVEIACDFSEYRYERRKANGVMVECELKKGDDISLWYLSKYIKKFGFVETNDSKQKAAKKSLNLI